LSSIDWGHRETVSLAGPSDFEKIFDFAPYISHRRKRLPPGKIFTLKTFCPELTGDTGKRSPSRVRATLKKFSISPLIYRTAEKGFRLGKFLFLKLFAQNSPGNRYPIWDTLLEVLLVASSMTPLRLLMTVQVTMTAQSFGGSSFRTPLHDIMDSSG